MSQQPQALPLLKLRSDLQFTPQSYGGTPCYLLEDPLNAAFFRLGIPEYQLLQHLDGQTSLESLLEDPELELSAEQIQLLSQWLIQHRLAYIHTERGWQLFQAKTDSAQKFARYFNWLFIRVPLGSPDRIISRLLPYLRGLLTWPFFLLWLIVCISGAWQVASHHERFMQAADSVLAVNNLGWLLLAWIVVKTVHELFHGLVCKRYGGYIHQAGILLILFAPIGGYVNASSSWKFTSRWQRMHVSIAGMYIELFLAGLAAWVWAYSEAGEINYLAYNMVLITSLATVLFNANPLMRFDGYYVLTDLVDIPNLYTLGQKYVAYLNQRYLQGRAVNDPVRGQSHAWFIRAYGLTALVWRWLVTITLLVLAHLLWHGAGVVLAILAAVIMLVLPLTRFLLNIHKHPQRGAIMRRMALLFGIGGALAAVVLTQVYWSPQLSAPAIVDYAQESVMRADSAGFIRKIAVQSGQTVQEGDLLLVLDNPSLVAERDDLALQLHIHRLKQQQHLSNEQLSDYQAEAAKLQELQDKWRDLAQQVQHLSLYAPHAGTVLAQGLDDWQGRYVERGTELLSIADASQYKVMVSVAQQDIDSFRAQIGTPVTVYRDSQPLQALPAVLSQVKPSASQEIVYPALTALGGGKLAVQRRLAQTDSTNRLNDNEPQQEYEHLQPRFMAVVEFKPLPSGLVAGEPAQLLLAQPSRSLWYSLRLSVQRYIEAIIARGEQATK